MSATQPRDDDGARYTLDEAAAELKRRQCTTEGHDFEVSAVWGKPDPVAIFCSNCGKKWRVAQ